MVIFTNSNNALSKCYVMFLVITPPKSDCVCTKKAEVAPAKEEKKVVAKKASAKKVAKTTKKTSKK